MSQQHNIQIVVTETGLDQVGSAMNNFANTSATVVKSQDALASSMGKTEGAAIKTGKEFGNLSKEELKTEKSSTTLGQAIKGSALQITAFASGLVSSISQFISYQKAGASLEKQHATLDKRWLSLQQSQKKLAAEIKNGTISKEEAAVQSQKLELQEKALEAQTDIITAKDQQYSLQLVSLASSVLPTVINAVGAVTDIYGQLKGGVDVATASVDAGSESFDGLGTAADTATTTGLIPTAKQILTMIPGVDKLAKAIGIGKNEGLTGAVAFNAAQVAEHGKASNVFIRAFKDMGGAISTFASNIKTEMGAATGFIDKSKAGFTSFFSQLGAGLTGVGTSLKGAGNAIKGFATALATAFISNPILGVITAIGAAIAGLIFNVGGFRDRLNELGVTLGKMAPWAKPFLDVLGWIGERFADIGNWIMGTNQLADATTGAGQAARKAADDFDTHFKAIQKSFIISQDFAKFEGIVENLKKVKTAIVDMSTSTTQAGQTINKDVGLAATAFETFVSGVVKGVPEVDAKIKQIQQTFRDMETNTITLAEGEKLLGVQLAELEGLLVDNIHTSQEKIKADKESALAIQGTSDVMTNAEKVIKSHTAELQSNEDVFIKFVKAYTEGNFKIIEAMDLEDAQIIELMDRYKKEFPNGSMVVKQFGQDVIVSLDTIKERFGASSKDITAFVGNIEKELSPAMDLMKNSFTLAQKAVFDYEQEQKLAIDVDRLAAAGITKNSAQFVQAIDAIVKKYPELKLSAEKVRDAIVKAEDDQTKAKEKENETVDKQIEKIKSLAETRQEEIKSMKMLQAQATIMITTLGRQIEVQGMTGEGLQKLIQVQDDTANAYGIAADSVGLWWAELEKSQAVEESERKILIQFARDHQVTLPDAIKNGSIKAMKDYIAQATGMAEATEDAAKRAATAFDTLSNQASSAMENLVQEDVISGDFDKVIKKVEEAGSSIDVLSTKQAIIKPILDDDDFKNDVLGINEILDDTWAQAELKAVGGGQGVIQAFTDGIINLLGSEAQPLVDHINEIWKQVKAQAPAGATGAELITLFQQAMDKPAEFLATGKKLSTSTAEGFKSGTPAILTAGQQAMVKLLEPYGKAAQDAYIASVGIADKTKEGIDTLPPKAETALAPVEGVFSAAFLKASVASTGVLNALFADIYTSMQFMITNTSEQLAQILALWNTHAINVGTATTNINLNILTVQKTLSDLSVNVATYTKSMTTNIANWGIAAITAFSNVAKQILVTQGVFSDMSKNVATYMTSMAKNIQGFADAAGKSFKQAGDAAFAAQGVMSKMSTSVATYMSSMTSHVQSFSSACVKAFDAVGKAADAAAQKVKALQSAINALKDKTVTITTRYVTVGSPGGRFGGSTIGYARGGDSWIQDKPGKVGGMNVGEFSKPELITVTPLTNPYDVQDKTISIPSQKKSVPIIPMGSQNNSNRPIQVTGDLYVTVSTQSGETLANEVKPFLLKGFSGIT